MRFAPKISEEVTVGSMAKQSRIDGDWFLRL
jgi:hypothetical protein